MVYSTDKNCKIGNMLYLYIYIIALPKITQGEYCSDISVYPTTQF
jgi:hypothetical protein